MSVATFLALGRVRNMAVQYSGPADWYKFIHAIFAINFDIPKHVDTCSYLIKQSFKKLFVTWLWQLPREY